jgi:hypothetical protein
MSHLWLGAAALAACLLPLSWSAHAVERNLPKAILDQIKVCLPQEEQLGPPVYETGFVTRPKIPGHAEIDVVLLDYSHFLCHEENSFLTDYCGSAGCLTQVFVRCAHGDAKCREGEYKKVYDSLTEGITFSADGKRAKMIIRYSTCGGGPTSKVCSEVFYWNGNDFTQAPLPQSP